jgi:hypothetical protein
MAQCDAQLPLDGAVQPDDAYLGGDRPGRVAQSIQATLPSGYAPGPKRRPAGSTSDGVPTLHGPDANCAHAPPHIGVAAGNWPHR